MVPLMKGLGIDTDRIVIDPPPEFFNVTKQIHNLLQGAEGGLTPEDLQLYLGSIREVAEDMRRNRLTADVWFVHDPQVLPLGPVPAPRGRPDLDMGHPHRPHHTQQGDPGHPPAVYQGLRPAHLLPGLLRSRGPGQGPKRVHCSPGHRPAHRQEHPHGPAGRPQTGVRHGHRPGPPSWPSRCPASTFGKTPGA